MVDLGKRLFRFGIVTDVHIAETEHGASSPFPVNRLTSWRYRHLVNRLNEQAFDFLINLGDMVHPLPSLPTYDEAARRFFKLSEDLRHTQYFIPGNHDAGDKPSTWMPARPVDKEALARYQKHFGPDYHAFVHEGIVFVMVNAELLNSRLPQRNEQRLWLEQCLRENAGQRFFIMIHYPPFLCDVHEVDHYDNIAEPDRSWLLALLEKHGVEAVFSGHVHNFWYNQLGNTDFYVVPSAAFPRQDYAEMYQTEPEPEGGRNDPAKLGFLSVDVHEKSHIWRLHRTFGEGLEPGETYISRPRPAMRHPLEYNKATVGFDLRNSWITFHQVPPSGALDEFYRKEVRNDYPLLALCEMGARSLRIPINDLLDVRVRARLATLKRIGFEYTVYCLGMPEEETLRVLADYHDMLSVLQLVWPQDKCHGLDRALETLRSRLAGVALFVSPLWSEHGRADTDGRHYHVVNHGFKAVEGFAVEDFFGTSLLPPALDGLVFVVDIDPDFVVTANEIDMEMEKAGLAAHVIARVARINPAEWLSDPHRTADLVAIAQLAAQLVNRTTIHLDTLIDVDRGYFRRAGLVDRQYNPRAAWHALLALREMADSQSLRLADTRPKCLGGWCLFPVSMRSGHGLLVVGSDRLGSHQNWQFQCGDCDIFDLADPWKKIGKVTSGNGLQAMLSKHSGSGPFLCVPA